MNLTDIAAAVGVHKSTVSRQAKRAGLVGADGLVDLDAYRALRTTGLDPALQTTGRQIPVAEEDQGSLAAARTRKMEADATLAELALARQRGELVEAGAMESAYEDLFRRLRDRILIVPREVAGDCARLAEEIGIEARMTQSLKAALAEFAAGPMEMKPDAGGAA
jgi:hypothetical protein